MLRNNSGLWNATELGQACGVKPVNPMECRGVSIDSRTLTPGDLFVAIRGPQADGHQHIDHAIQQGARGIMVDHDEASWQNYSRIIVPDCEQGLRDLAKFARSRTTATVVGITGSFGKTSIKDALNFLLVNHGQRVTVTQRSFNNHWGVPLTLANLHAEDQFGVFEMGMNHAGELELLSNLVHPQVALINNVGLMHQVHFSGLDSIARAKAEIFKGMAPGAVAILNEDFGPFTLLRELAQESGLKVISFSCHNPQAPFYLQDLTQGADGQQLTIQTPQGILKVRLSIRAEIWQANTLALLALLYACDLDLKDFMPSFPLLKQSPGRGEIHTFLNDSKTFSVIDESYNAGPDSMKAALISLSQYPTQSPGQRIAILGDMLELGAQEKQIHADLSALIKTLSIDQVHCCGTLMESLYQALPVDKRGSWALTPVDLWPMIAPSFGACDTVMIKGSRGQRAYDGRMAYFVQQLMQLKSNTTSDAL